MSRTSRYALYREQKGKRDCVLPPIRLHTVELNWLKQQAIERGLSFSEFARLRLLHPVTLRRKHPSSVSTPLWIEARKQQRKKVGGAPPGETLAKDQTPKSEPPPRFVRNAQVSSYGLPLFEHEKQKRPVQCWHGWPLHQCFTCNNI